MNFEDIFGPEGLIASGLPAYDFRPQQFQMAEMVAKAINEEKHLVVEAGTGVGKSFAYLIPAICHAVSNYERVIVSTYTINLQEQLIEKDIPFLQKVLSLPFRAMLVKGRSNYICLRRWERVVSEEEDLFGRREEERSLEMIAGWLSKTSDGSLSDMDEIPANNVWTKVCSEHGNCLGKECIYKDKCFFRKAREKMHEAHVLVVNHHLFFSNLALKKADANFLPPCKCIILDEAHHLESVAGDYLGLEISNFQVKYLLDSLGSRDKRKGLLVRLGAGEVLEYVEEARIQAGLFFDDILMFMERAEASVLRIREPGFVSSYVDGCLRKISVSLEELKLAAKTKEEELEISSWMRKCMNLTEEMNFFLDQALAGHVYWLEKRGRGNRNIILKSAPVDINEELDKELFRKVPTVIMTSATLVTDGSFDYFKKRIGTDESLELKAGSPFDYEEQVTLYLAGNLPEPRQAELYQEKIIEQVKHYLEMTEGKAFVLFTSYKLMNEVYDELQPFLENRGINSFRQGDGLPRNAMLESFRKDINSVLFGTDSFWTGVDVQGGSLSNVIITKLPFDVPSHPLIETRIESIKEKGGDPFLEYTLPEAIIKLKQGFGRLIRNREDKGIIVILDSRILTRSYGKTFLNSLPKCRLIID